MTKPTSIFATRQHPHRHSVLPRRPTYLPSTEDLDHVRPGKPHSRSHGIYSLFSSRTPPDLTLPTSPSCSSTAKNLPRSSTCRVTIGPCAKPPSGPPLRHLLPPRHPTPNPALILPLRLRFIPTLPSREVSSPNWVSDLDRERRSPKTRRVIQRIAGKLEDTRSRSSYQNPHQHLNHIQPHLERSSPNPTITRSPRLIRTT